MRLGVRFAGCLLAAVAVAGYAACATPHGNFAPEGPVGSSGEIKSYSDAKREYVRLLEVALGGAHPAFRLLEIPPYAPVYRPGTPLSIGPGLPDALTRTCVIQNIPRETAVGEPAIAESVRTFRAHTDFPPPLQRAVALFGEFRAVMSANPIGLFNYTDLGIITVPLAHFDRELLDNPVCLLEIAGLDVVMVRGIVRAAESAVSQRGLSGERAVKTLKQDALEVRFAPAGGYSVIDAERRPRFWYVAETRIDVPGLSTASRAQKFEIIGKCLEEPKCRARISIRNSPPGDVALQAVEYNLATTAFNRFHSGTSIEERWWREAADAVPAVAR